MERKIGEIFEYSNEWYQAIEGIGCRGCDFKCIIPSPLIKGCATLNFKKLEKVRELYKKRISDGTFSTFQRYKVYNSVILPKKPYMYYNFIDGTIEIELKNKEDMEDLDKIKVRDYTKVEELNVIEENKLNLKPFDIQKAREGKPVCTRDGRKARIICFDYKENKPIIAIVSDNVGEKDIITYTNKGEVISNKINSDDLMMLPEKKKKEGWTNIYSLNTCYSSKEEAEANIDQDYEHEYVRTVKINWEE